VRQLAVAALCGAALIGGAAALAPTDTSALARSVGDESGLPEPIGVTGQVQEVAEDKKSFRLKAPKGPFTVTWAKGTRFEVHAEKTLGDIQPGTKVYVLAEPVEEQPATGGGNFPPQLIKIQAIVAGAFTPPEVPAKLASQRIRWVTGDLERRGKELYVEGHLLGAGASREVLLVTQGTAAPPDPKTALFVAGYLDTADKSKRIAATEIIRIAADYPAYEFTHDLRSRKPDPAKKKKEEFGV